MKKHIIFDTHCDTAGLILDKRHTLSSQNQHININGMKRYLNYAQFFAAYISEDYISSPLERTLSLIDAITYQAKNSKDMMLCKNSSDLDSAWKNNKIAAFISIENALGIDDLKSLDLLYKKGVRMMSLTWNEDNHLGGGAYGKNIGLTDLGYSVIRKMNELGIIVDVSHSSENTFYDICSDSSAPVIASHSNSYTLCPDRRNLKDEQFIKIKEKGGVVGINYYPPFLTKNNSCTYKYIVRHIMHFLSLGGEDNICLGSDFDGIDYIADGISGVADVYKILDTLSQLGVSEHIIEKIAYKNILRIIGICL